MSGAYIARKIKGRRIDEHRLIMEQHLGYKLDRHTVVHHINGDKSDNRIENLAIMSLSEHSRVHQTGHKPRPLSDEGRKRLRIAGKQHMRCSQKKVAKYTLDGTLICVYECINDTEHDGFQRCHVRACCDNRRKTHKGFIWRLV